METDKHYFIEGLFIIGLSIAAAFFFVWLAKSGHRDDVLYRIHFAESVQRPCAGRSSQVSRRRHRDSQDDGPRCRRTRGVCRWMSACARTHRSRPIPRPRLKLKGITGVVLHRAERRKRRRENAGCGHGRGSGSGNSRGKAASPRFSISCRK